MLHYELGDLSATKNQLIDTLRLAPDDAWSYVVQWNIFTCEQGSDSAIRFFTKALDLKPDNPYALNGLGAASAKSGDSASANVSVTKNSQNKLLHAPLGKQRDGYLKVCVRDFPSPTPHDTATRGHNPLRQKVTLPRQPPIEEIRLVNVNEILVRD